MSANKAVIRTLLNTDGYQIGQDESRFDRARISCPDPLLQRYIPKIMRFYYPEDPVLLLVLVFGGNVNTNCKPKS